MDIVYHFWELFDLSNVPIAEYLTGSSAKRALPVVPPMRAFKRKLSMALFHHRILEDFESICRVLPTLY